MGWSEADLLSALRGNAALRARNVALFQSQAAPVLPTLDRPAAPGSRAKRLDGYASALEARYAEYLAALLHWKHIQGWWYEPLRLMLAPKTTYTPDFLVWLFDGRLACHEVKGYWRDDARVKIKVAAAKYPCFGFVGITWAQGAWREEWF